MPVIAMEHVRHESEPPATLDRRAREQQKAPVLVGIRRIKGRTIEQLRAVDEVDGCLVSGYVAVRTANGYSVSPIVILACCSPSTGCRFGYARRTAAYSGMNACTS